MSSTKLEAATVPGVHLQVAQDFSPGQSPQRVTDPQGVASCLQISQTTAIIQGAQLSQRGKLGINTTPDPNYDLHVGGANSVRFELGTSNQFSMGGAGVVNVDAPDIIGGRFTIKNDGKVGIKKPNPEADLDVNGTIKATGLTFSGPLAVPGMQKVQALDGLKPVFINPTTGMLYYLG